ncbi:6-hydroxymethylpterin diphosphokinase MptE-like protein [Nitrosopumilus sp.]|uniref:6-hydroxymethylpterin diphosphokinase MptE-like protein n=1 Tax=Nitrosopumilus sp. TaxID=2024843 RepID=UPI00293084DC|nr:6-hydroxymethylpterin diphosphokinase MptE-like protein [Nitrosopumilus sp.]
MIQYSDWKKKYSDILMEFNYKEEKDNESAKILNSILESSNIIEKISKLIKNKTVFVIGSGPSLSRSISKLKNYKNSVKIAADSSLKPLVENGVVPDIIVTDLDGDRDTLEKITRTQSSIFVVHAHADNKTKLELAKNFKKCIGTTQAKPFGKIKNFGGFTDGDRGVFLASHFCAKKIILFGMDFGERIGKFSNTKRSERKIKLMKLKKGEFLLEWLSTFTRSELFTTSRPIKGFKKITYRELDITIT